MNKDLEMRVAALERRLEALLEELSGTTGAILNDIEYDRCLQLREEARKE